MPIQPINYLNAPIVKSPWEQDFAKLLAQGMALRHEPQRLMREKEKELLANALNKEKVGQAQAEAPYHGINAQNQSAITANTALNAPKVSESELRKTESEIFKNNESAKMGGAPLSGPAAMVASVERLGQIHGKNSQVYKDAKYGLDTLFGQREIRPVREQNAIRSAQEKINKPGATQKEISEGQRIIRSVQLEALKNSSDPGIRLKVDQGENIQKTMDEIDFDVLSKGAGPAGKKWLIMQATKALKGNESSDYLKYQTSMKGLKFLAHQGGQFYDTPAAIEAQKDLKKMISDPRFFSNPRILKAEYDMVRRIFNKEHQTFLDRMLYQNDEIQKVTGRLNNREAPQANNNGRTRTLDTNNWSFS